MSSQTSNSVSATSGEGTDGTRYSSSVDRLMSGVGNVFAPSSAPPTYNSALYDPTEQQMAAGHREVARMTARARRPYPQDNLTVRQHGTTDFAQTMDGEPLTTFIFVDGVQELGWYAGGGPLHHIRTSSSLAIFLPLPLRSGDAAGRAQIIMCFTDMDVAEYAVNAIRHFGNPVVFPTPRLDLAVYCVSAKQFCNLAGRYFAATRAADYTPPEPANFGQTFVGGFDGQILVHAREEYRSALRTAGAKPKLVDAIEQNVRDFIHSESGIRAFRCVRSGSDQSVKTYHIELNSPRAADKIVSDLSEYPNGFERNGIKIWTCHFSFNALNGPNPAARTTTYENPLSDRLNPAVRGHGIGTAPELRNGGAYEKLYPIRLGRSNNVVEMRKVIHGLDVRTTIMLRDIPNEMSFDDLKMFLDQFVGCTYDFLYLRFDFTTKKNVGYAFINFTHAVDMVPLLLYAVGEFWPKSSKRVAVSYATMQGRDALEGKFKNSCVMKENEAFRPKLYYTTGPWAGEEEPFPPPDNEAKMARSSLNLNTIGLYSSTSYNNRQRLGRFDRGNPNAAIESLVDENRRLRQALGRHRR